MSSLEAQNAVLRQAILVCDRLADACLQGTDVGMLVFLAADFLGRQVVILDPALRTRAAAWPGGPPDLVSVDGRHPPGPGGLPRSGTAPAGDDNPLGWQMSDPRVERLLSTLCGSRRPMRVPTLPGWRAKGGTVVAPIAVGDLLLGYLAMISEDPSEEASPTDEVELLTISHLSTIYALALTRERREQGGPDARRAEVMAELLAGTVDDADAAAERATSVGLPTTGPLRLVVARPEGMAEDGSPAGGPGATPGDGRPAPGTSALEVSGEAGSDAPALQALRSHLLDELATRIEQLVPGAVAVTRTDEVVALAPEPASGARRPAQPTIAERLSREFDRAGPLPAAPSAGAGSWPGTPLPIGSGGPAAGMMIGVSGRCHSLGDVGRTYRQTRLAFELVRRLGHSRRVVDCDHLGAYRLLLQLGEVDELRSFAAEVLGPLIDHDRTHRAELLRTLAAFLEHHGRALPAARALFVHVNTVSYRLRRIESLSGLDLSDPDDRLVAHVALKIVEGLGTAPDGHVPRARTRPAFAGSSNGREGSLEPSSNDMLR
ncbi:MAG: helix-turn-helix domain-containing protein [Acidimicrobiales bacterium]|nr:helix-turn-helix domain-containing protein [Acidimicrobiales bacterium]